MRPASICFVAPHALGALEARFGRPSSRGFGGAEVQMALLAAGLADRGHEIVFLCHGQRPGRLESRVGPVRVVESGPGRLLPPFVDLWRLLHRELAGVRPDIVYQRCGLPLTGMTAVSCRRLGVPFVFAAANDRDVDGRSRQSLGAVRDAFYRWGLRRADLVVVQTAEQERLLSGMAAVPATRIPSAVDLPGTVAPAPEPPVVLWVGSLLRKKRPLELLRLARALPEYRFVAAAPTATEPDTAGRFAAEARALTNVDWRDRVPYAEMDGLYRSGAVLLNTSEAEGVPNTFLEAWARGRPVFSLGIDPDGIVARRGLGRVAGAGAPEDELRGFLQDGQARRLAGEAGRQYVQETHALDRVIDLYEAAFAPLAGPA